MNSHAAMFIQDLAIIMLIAGLTTIMFRQFKQPIVLGYILAGIIIGPHTPPFSFIYDEKIIKTLGELGVIFLMFSLGLEFDLHKLSKVGKTAVIAATLEIVLMLWLGYELGILFGWSQIHAIFLGAILSISSTTIIVKALNELDMASKRFSQIIFGILIVEDIFAIIILTLLSSIAVTGTLYITDIFITTMKLSAFLVATLVIGIMLIPKLLAYISRFNSNEMLLISVLGLCFGFCLLVLKLDYSIALGAFIMGAIIAESDQITKIGYLVNPVRDMFSAIFFVTVGLLFNPTVFLAYLTPIIIITFAVVVGKVLSCSLGTLMGGSDGKTSMKVGMGLAQIGEFSFIIASLGIALNVTENFLYSIAVSVSIITTLLTPYLIKYSDYATNTIARYIPATVTKTFSIYSYWMTNIQPTQDQKLLKSAVNRALIQIIVNYLLVVAVFSMGIYVANTGLGNTLIQVSNIYIKKSIIWALSLIISLPFLVAAYRKIYALSMILAEMNIKDKMENRITLKVRSIISQLIPIFSIAIMMLLIFALSASILPPIELLILILMLAIILLLFLWRWFIKIHARLQSTMIENLKSNEINKK